jgi:hypothetical protein
MKPLSMYVFVFVVPTIVVVGGCSNEPSQADIWQMFEAKGKEHGDVLLHEAKLLGCKDSGEPQRGYNFYCDVEVEATTPSSGRQKEILAIEISKGTKERWVLTNTRKKISELRGRYVDALNTMTVVFELGGEASLFRKEGGSYAGKYEIDGRKVKIMTRGGEILITLNLYDDGTLWMDSDKGRNHFKKT